MQAINHKGVAYDSCDDAALKKAVSVWPVWSGLVITLQATYFHISFPAYTQILLTPVRIHLALSGGPRDYIAQKELEPSPSSSQISHV